MPAAFTGGNRQRGQGFSDMPAAFTGGNRQRGQGQSDMPEAFNMGRRGGGGGGGRYEDYPTAFSGPARRRGGNDGYQDSLSLAASAISMGKVGRATLGAFLGEAPTAGPVVRKSSVMQQQRETTPKEEFPSLKGVEEFPSLNPGAPAFGGAKWGDIMDDEAQQRTQISFKDALKTQYDEY
eukprot:TRINITY_DN209_c1_g1_i10.p3 TRINITY_DN209_c1_g1~~TRINITY_DN209_c1_g1_i10.p3  ORF type:complete len:180 (-),score=33.71 TRINITY_DN209_c1_g1_i10:519-1058(-)